jgi:hypothetical protein
MSDQKDSMSIVYEEPDDRPTVVASGAYGGPSPDGSVVVAHLFTEYGTIPSIEEHTVQQGGVVNLEGGSRIKRGDVTRRVQATIVLSPESAARLGKFLLEKAQLASQIRSQNPA